MKKILLSLCFPLVLGAEIVLLSPESGEKILLLPENQRKLLSLPSHQKRVEVLAADRKKGPKYGFHAPELLWKSPLPVKFAWSSSEKDGKNIFAVLVSETPDFKKFKTVFARGTQVTAQPHLLNLHPGRKYYWQVVSARGAERSATGTFSTDPQPPRWIMLEGPCINVRDLGGYKTSDGKTVKYGMLIRGERLNNNSGNHFHPGRNRLTVEDLNVFRNDLKIRTDLDLRGKAETAGMTCSPLGKDVSFQNCPASSYHRIFTPQGKINTVRIFRVLAKKENYPIYFHCSGGADRTGAIALIANGLLGVSENDLCADWGNTFYPRLPDNMNQRIRENFNFAGMIKSFSAYGKPEDPLSRKIENYLISGGITPQEIAAFRKLMCEK